jgi:hypothetical protein
MFIKIKALSIIILFLFTCVAIVISTLNNSVLAENNNICETNNLKNLESGDLVFCEIRDIWKLLGGHDVKKGYDHIAIYRGKGYINFKGEFVENNKFGTHYVIESTYFPFPKVRYTQIRCLFMYSKLDYAKVENANITIKTKAINFAESQLGCSYQHFFLMTKKDNPRFMWDYKKWDENDPGYKFRKHANFKPDDPKDPLSNWYYCAEFVWSSYYNAGIDLDPIFPEDMDSNGEPDTIEDYGYFRYVSPQNIYDSTNTTSI